MLERHKKGIKSDCLIAVMFILMTVFISNACAQYNGECWATDYTNVFKITGNKAEKFVGFSQPLSLSINPIDGVCWVADTDAVRVKKLSSTGKELASISGGDIFPNNPSSVSVDPRDGSCWVAIIDTVYKFSSEAKQLFKQKGFNEPVLAVNPKNGECWIADSNNARLVRLSAEGAQLGVLQLEGMSQPKSLSINPTDGTCWVLDAFAQKAMKLLPDGKVLSQASVAPASGGIMATSLSASLDGGCWVAVMVDTVNDVVLKLSADGKQALSVGGFAMPYSVAYDPKDHGCWVADSNNGRIVKLSSAGQKVHDIKGFYQPKVVTVAYKEKKQ